MATLIWPFAREGTRAANRVQLAPNAHLRFHDIDLHDNHDYGRHRVCHPGAETVVERNRPSRPVTLPTPAPNRLTFLPDPSVVATQREGSVQTRRTG